MISGVHPSTPVQQIRLSSTGLAKIHGPHAALAVRSHIHSGHAVTDGVVQHAVMMAAVMRLANAAQQAWLAFDFYRPQRSRDALAHPVLPFESSFLDRYVKSVAKSRIIRIGIAEVGALCTAITLLRLLDHRHWRCAGLGWAGMFASARMVTKASDDKREDNFGFVSVMQNLLLMANSVCPPRH